MRKMKEKRGKEDEREVKQKGREEKEEMGGLIWRGRGRGGLKWREGREAVIYEYGERKGKKEGERDRRKKEKQGDNGECKKRKS